MVSVLNYRSNSLGSIPGRGENYCKKVLIKKRAMGQ